MLTRGTPSICLSPTGNCQCSYFFFSLATGQIIKHCGLTEILVPQLVIDRVAHIARKTNSSAGLVFAYRHCQPFDWPNKGIIDVDNTPMAPYPDIPAEFLGVQLNWSSHPAPPTSATTTPNEPDWVQMADDIIANADLNHDDHLPAPPKVIVIDDDDNDPLPTQTKQTLVYLPKIEPDSPSQVISPPSHHYPTRHSQPPKHLENFHLFTTVVEDTRTSYPYVDATGKMVDLALTDENTIAQVCHQVMLHCADSICLGNPNNTKQHGLKAGLHKFADHGNDALMKKLRQFHLLKCFTPKDPKTLSRDDKYNGLASLMFLTKKRSGEIKVHGCADGSKQRDHIAKEEASAPTVTLDAIFIQATIFAHEKRDVTTCDIPGTFLQAYNLDYVLMHLDGILAELMVTVAPNIHRKYITTNAKGKPVLYV